MGFPTFHIDKTIAPLAQVDREPVICARVMDQVNESFRWRDRFRARIMHGEMDAPDRFVP